MCRRRSQGAVIGYGKFLTVLVNFLTIAGALFLVVPALNRLQLHEASKPVPPEPPPGVKLLTQIRELLTAPK